MNKYTNLLDGTHYALDYKLIQYTHFTAAKNALTTFVLVSMLYTAQPF